MQERLNIAWTTVETKSAAEQLARHWIQEQAVVCVQIDGPIEYVYCWEGSVHTSIEFRLMVKFLDAQQQKVELILQQQHPYDVPQWIVVKADHVGEAYYKWAEGSVK